MDEKSAPTLPVPPPGLPTPNPPDGAIPRGPMSSWMTWKHKVLFAVLFVAAIAAWMLMGLPQFWNWP